MTIQTILNTKDGGADIIRIDAQKRVIAAVELMMQNRIGALVVSNNAQTCVGILSERDIMRGLAKDGGRILDALVGDFMTKDLYSVTPDMAIGQAMQIMTENRCRHLPVFEKEDLCGIVSIGDLVNFRINEARREADALKAYIATG